MKYIFAFDIVIDYLNYIIEGTPVSTRETKATVIYKRENSLGTGGSNAEVNVDVNNVESNIHESLLNAVNGELGYFDKGTALSCNLSFEIAYIC